MAHRKTVRHFHEVGHLHELTFSCYRRLPLLTNDVWREKLARCVEAADEDYTYDAVDRLTEWKLNNVSQETWTLDSLGNNLNTSTGGTYNAANEQTTIAGSSVTPTYDAAGNMTTLSTGNTAKYDAWNRLVQVTSGSGETLTVVAKYEYDGANRQIQAFDVQQLQQDVADLFRVWLAGKAPDKLLWPGPWRQHAAEILRTDLAAAGVPFKTETGKIDFHAVGRVAYITRVVASAAPLALVLRITRLSSPSLLDCYYRPSDRDRSEVIAALPALV